MKGNLDNYQVEDIKDFFDIRLNQDISHIEKNFFNKNIETYDKDCFRKIVSNCKMMLKIKLPKSCNKEVLTNLIKEYEDAVEPLKGKTYDNSDLKISIRTIDSVCKTMNLLANEEEFKVVK